MNDPFLKEELKYLNSISMSEDILDIKPIYLNNDFIDSRVKYYENIKNNNAKRIYSLLIKVSIIFAVIIIAILFILRSKMIGDMFKSMFLPLIIFVGLYLLLFVGYFFFKYKKEQVKIDNNQLLIDKLNYIKQKISTGMFSVEGVPAAQWEPGKLLELSNSVYSHTTKKAMKSKIYEDAFYSAILLTMGYIVKGYLNGIVGIIVGLILLLFLGLSIYNIIRQLKKFK